MYDMRNIGTTLAEVSNALSTLTEDQMTRELLRANAQRLNLGAIRLAVLGNSNAGKSTLINALLRTIAVPESGNTASPIPVWFAAGEDELRYSVYTRAEDGDRCVHPDTDTFIKQYCYNLMDITDDKRVRFSDVLWASARVQSSYLKETGFTLIDTLGINATAADTVKTIATIDTGIDIVIFVTARVDLLQSDLRFLREHVLGYGERVVPYPVKPSQLLLVYNDKGMSGATLAHLQNSAEKLLKGAPHEEIETFKQNNIIMLNALAARRVRCGAYDYQRFAPAGTLDMEMTGLAQKTQSEREAVANPSTQMQQEARRFDLLEQRLSELVEQMMTNADGVVEQRVMQLEAVMRAIRAQTNASISMREKERAVVQQKINGIAAVNKTFIKANAEIASVFDEQRAAMRSAIRKTLETKRDTELKSLVGSLYTMTKPPEFITVVTMNNFRHATGLEKEKILEGWIRYVLENRFIPEASRQFKKLLLETNVQEGDPHFTIRDTVHFQVEEARRLAMSQSVRMKNFCENIRAQGADDIGMSVPTDDTIEAWFVSMASEMETAILEAIAKLQHEAYRELNSQMSKITRTIRVKGVLNRIMQFFGNVNQFWLAVRNNAVVPAAGMICFEWFNTTPSSADANMYGGIDEAYKRVQEKVVSSLNRQTVQVDAYLSKLQIDLESRQQDVKQASAISDETVKQLDRQQEKLNELRR